jgi:hypothetical protein
LFSALDLAQEHRLSIAMILLNILTTVLLLSMFLAETAALVFL